jgi:hypothetical protein
MTDTHKPPSPPRVRFEWIGEAWRLFAAAPGIWISSLTVAGIVNCAAFLVALSAFGVEAHVRDILQAAWQDILNGDASALNHTLNQLATLYRLPGYWLTLLATTAVAAFVYAGLQRMANAQVRGEIIAAEMIFGGSRVFGNYLVYTLIASIPSFATQAVPNIGPLFIFLHIVEVATYVLVAPGYAAVADGAAPIDALAKSLKATLPNLLHGLVFFAAFSMICIISALPCLLGLTVTTPMITIIFTLAYRDMIGMRDTNEPPAR